MSDPCARVSSRILLVDHVCTRQCVGQDLVIMHYKRLCLPTASQGHRYKSFLPSKDVYLAPPSAFLVAAMMKLYIGTRHPVASSSSDPAGNTVKDDFPEALTYRFNDNSAWVPAARTHEVSSILFPIVLIVPADEPRASLRRLSTLRSTHTRNCGAFDVIASRFTQLESRVSRVSHRQHGNLSCGAFPHITSWT
jgi:hypothetical protein